MENNNESPSNATATPASPFRQKVKTNDPQITVQGQVKTTERGEIIVFEIPLVFFRVVCIVPIPDDGCDTAPVYVKFKVSNRLPT